MFIEIKTYVFTANKNRNYQTRLLNFNFVKDIRRLEDGVELKIDNEKYSVFSEMPYDMLKKLLLGGKKNV